jgi:hypothetical protein
MRWRNECGESWVLDLGDGPSSWERLGWSVSTRDAASTRLRLKGRHCLRHAISQDKLFSQLDVRSALGYLGLVEKNNTRNSLVTFLNTRDYLNQRSNCYWYFLLKVDARYIYICVRINLTTASYICQSSDAKVNIYRLRQH